MTSYDSHAEYSEHVLLLSTVGSHAHRFYYITLLKWSSVSALTGTKTLGGDKVSMLIHTYPHKPLQKVKVTICNHQADSPLYVWPNV